MRGALQVQRRAAREVCPYCRDGLGAFTLHTCEDCAADHHLTCWNLHGGCASCGRQGRVAPPPTDRPYTLSPARRAELTSQVETERAQREARRRGLDRRDRWQVTLLCLCSLGLATWFGFFEADLVRALEELALGRGAHHLWLVGSWSALVIAICAGWVMGMRQIARRGS